MLKWRNVGHDKAHEVTRSGRQDEYGHLYRKFKINCHSIDHQYYHQLFYGLSTGQFYTMTGSCNMWLYAASPQLQCNGRLIKKEEDRYIEV